MAKAEHVSPEQLDQLVTAALAFSELCRELDIEPGTSLMGVYYGIDPLVKEAQSLGEQRLKASLAEWLRNY